MKILHSADWHLGRTINGFNLLELQKDAIGQIIELIKEQAVDVIVLAGDIYDRAIPGVEATLVFDHFLTEVALNLKKHIIIISGNHDSYERLGFGNDLFRQVGIHLARVLEKDFDKLTLYDQSGPVNFYLWPYQSYFYLKEKYPDGKFESYNDAFKYLLSQVEVNNEERNVFVGHSYYTYGIEKNLIESDSERELSIGGADFLDSKLLKSYDLALFGHLHGPQKVGPETFRYAGSPLKYSFSETNHKKSVTIYDIQEKGKIDYRLFPIKPLHDMKIIEGFLHDIINQPIDGVDKDDLIQVILLDDQKVYEPMAAIRERYPNVIELKYKKTVIEEAELQSGDVQKKDFITLYSEFYEKMSNNPLSEEQLLVIKDAYQKVLEGSTDEDN